jgi:hypothetical protein
MYMHCQGCVWYLLVKDDQKWLPPLDYVWTETAFYEESFSMKYWTCLYHSVLMLTGNDIGPRGSIQVGSIY